MDMRVTTQRMPPERQFRGSLQPGQLLKSTDGEGVNVPALAATFHCDNALISASARIVGESSHRTTQLACSCRRVADASLMFAAIGRFQPR